MNNFYQEQNLYHEDLLNKLNKQHTTISFTRLIVFVIFSITLILALADQHYFLLIITFISIGIYLYLLNQHNKIEQDIKYHQSNFDITRDYLHRLDDDFAFFNKEEPKQVDSYYARDLDIFGKNSLFQYISLAKTTKGIERLASYLLNDNKDNKYQDIIKRQAAIKELGDDQSLHLDLASRVNQLDSLSNPVSFKGLTTFSKPYLLMIKGLSYILPIVLLVTLILGIFNVISYNYFFLMMIINIIITTVFAVKNYQSLKYLNENNNSIESLYYILKLIEDHDFKSVLLTDYQKILNEGVKGSQVIKRLKLIKDLSDSRRDFLTNLLLQGLFMWDFRITYLFEQLKEDTNLDLDKYFDICFELEALLSLGVIGQVKPTTSLPHLTDDTKPILKMKGVYHPLIKRTDVVENSFAADTSTTIITGSNMSGKTTFMRSIGINLLLAYAGSSVCAQKMDLSIMKLFTSIRVEDDLSQGISSFYAEINRVKDMVEYHKKDSAMISLIDEIFKGTNSLDRIYGAEAAIKALASKKSLVFISTHDFELSKLKGVKNVHFAEYYDNEQLKFDYQLKKGVSKTRNARNILKMAGISQEE